VGCRGRTKLLKRKEGTSSERCAQKRKGGKKKSGLRPFLICWGGGGGGGDWRGTDEIVSVMKKTPLYYEGGRGRGSIRRGAANEEKGGGLLVLISSNLLKERGGEASSFLDFRKEGGRSFLFSAHKDPAGRRVQCGAFMQLCQKEVGFSFDGEKKTASDRSGTRGNESWRTLIILLQRKKGGNIEAIPRQGEKRRKKSGFRSERRRKLRMLLPRRGREGEDSDVAGSL